MGLTAKLFIVAGLGAAFLVARWKDPAFDVESLKGARVLVTGASMGIGEQIAYHLAKAGAQIVITARRGHVLEKVVQKCLDLGAQKALFIPADMSVVADPDRVVTFAVDQLGGLDYLVLNHIGPSPFAMWDGDVEHVRWLMQVNFISFVQMTQKALPFLEQSKGSLMAVSSMLGKVCSPLALPYTATKFAINGFFGSLRHELAMKKSNVSISVCTLGLIDTESAMEKIKPYSDMPGHPASEAAWSIIQAGAKRQAESHYPSYTYYAGLFIDFVPSLRDYMIQNLYHYEP